MADKDDLLKDVLLIVKLSNRYDMKSPEVARLVYHKLQEKNLFKTAMGKKYTDRLKQIIYDEENNGICLICRKNSSKDGIVCEDCINKFSRDSGIEKKENTDSLYKTGVNDRKQILPKENIGRRRDYVENKVTLDEKISSKRNNIYDTKKNNKDKKMSDKVKIAIFTFFMVVVVMVFSLIRGRIIAGGTDIRDFIGMSEAEVTEKYKITSSRITDPIYIDLNIGSNPNFSIDTSNDKVAGVAVFSSYKGFQKFNLLGIKMGEKKDDVKTRLTGMKYVDHIFDDEDNFRLLATYKNEYIINFWIDYDGYIQAFSFYEIKPGYSMLWY